MGRSDRSHVCHLTGGDDQTRMKTHRTTIATAGQGRARRASSRRAAQGECSLQRLIVLAVCLRSQQSMKLAAQRWCSERRPRGCVSEDTSLERALTVVKSCVDVTHLQYGRNYNTQSARPVRMQSPGRKHFWLTLLLQCGHLQIT